MHFDIVQADHSHHGQLVDFQLRMALETEGLQLNRELVHDGVLAVLNDEHKGTYWMAQIEGQRVASMLVMSEWSDWRNGRVLWIHSVFVEPKHRRQGVFKAMYEFLKKRVQEDDTLKGLRLYVDTSNDRAQRVYRQLGMNRDHYALYEWMK